MKIFKTWHVWVTLLSFLTPDLSLGNVCPALLGNFSHSSFRLFLPS